MHCDAIWAWMEVRIGSVLVTNPEHAFIKSAKIEGMNQVGGPLVRHSSIVARASRRHSTMSWQLAASTQSRHAFRQSVYLKHIARHLDLCGGLHPISTYRSVAYRLRVDLNSRLDTARATKMKLSPTLILLAAITAAGAVKAADAISSPTNEGPLRDELNMKSNKATLGANSKMVVLPSERERIQRFYRDVLGCKIDVKPHADLVWLRPDFYIGVVYDNSALSEPDMLRSIWLELRTNDPIELKQSILKFGLREVAHEDKEHFYFQAPGGQVYRLAANSEDMNLYRPHSQPPEN